MEDETKSRELYAAGNSGITANIKTHKQELRIISQLRKQSLFTILNGFSLDREWSIK